jgi:hypothetical protein
MAVSYGVCADLVGTGPWVASVCFKGGATHRMRSCTRPFSRDAERMRLFSRITGNRTRSPEAIPVDLGRCRPVRAKGNSGLLFDQFSRLRCACGGQCSRDIGPQPLLKLSTNGPLPLCPSPKQRQPSPYPHARPHFCCESGVVFKKGRAGEGRGASERLAASQPRPSRALGREIGSG